MEYREKQQMMAMQNANQGQKAIAENGAVEGEHKEDPELKDAIEDCADVLQELREEIELQVL